MKVSGGWGQGCQSVSLVTKRSWPTLFITILIVISSKQYNNIL